MLRSITPQVCSSWVDRIASYCQHVSLKGRRKLYSWGGESGIETKIFIEATSEKNKAFVSDLSVFHFFFNFQSIASYKTLKREIPSNFLARQVSWLACCTAPYTLVSRAAERANQLVKRAKILFMTTANQQTLLKKTQKTKEFLASPADCNVFKFEFLRSSVDGKYLMFLQSENSVFKFLP